MRAYCTLHEKHIHMKLKALLLFFILASMIQQRALVQSVVVFSVLISLFTYGYLNHYVTSQQKQPESVKFMSNHSFKDHLSLYGKLNNKKTYHFTEEPHTEDRSKRPLVKVARHKATLSPPTRGYVLAEDFWEQLTSASRNLQNLQCWAKKTGVKVVEPFAMNSVLRTPLDPPKYSLKFSDLIDLESWNQESRGNGNEEIVPWEIFLREAPKNIIAVHFNYAHFKESIAAQKAVKMNPEKYPPRELRYKQCPPDKQEWPKQYLLKETGFKVVRKVCLNFAYGDILTMEELKTSIYDTLDPNNTTVYFRKWRGLAGYGRIPVKESGCYNTGLQEVMPPSAMLTRHTEEYISRYLFNRPYIAIIARLEKSKISSKNKPGIVPYCLTQTLNQWREMASNRGLNTTFLSIDMGKYRSNSFKYDNSIQKYFEKFFHSIYNDQWSISEWEGSFEEVGGTTDAGYIALLQKMIVTKATCVVFVGGGLFQKHAFSLYQARVPEHESCIRVVKECTQKNKLEIFHDHIY